MQEKAYSLEAQIQQCKEFAASKGYEITTVLTDVESGTKNDRAGYIKLKELIEARTFDTLIVYETSRISRQLLELLSFIELLQSNNIDFISATEQGYDTTTAEGKFAMSIRLSMIQFERDNTATRVTERLYFKASKGQWVAGKPPKGYKLVDKKLVVDEEEAWLIKDIFKRYLNGESMYKICLIHRVQYGSKAIKRILTNITYAGYISYGTRKNSNGNTKRSFIVPGTHEPLISKEDYDKVQEILHNTRRAPSKSNRYLLNGILECRECGHSFLGLPGKQYEKYPHYGCNLKRLKFSDKFIYKGCQCSSMNVKAQLLEKAVLSQIEAVINNLDSIESIDTQENPNEENILKRKLKSLESKKERVLEAYMDGFMNRDDYKKRLNSLGEDIVSLKKLLYNKRPLQNEKANKEKIIEYFRQIDLENIAQANAILRLIIDKIIVYRAKGTAKDDFEVEIYLNII